MTKKKTITKATSRVIIHSFMSKVDDTTYNTRETINRIIHLTKDITDFWSSAERWAPVEAAELLTRSRLDWQNSLAKQLPLFNDNQSTESGRLILAWVTLGSLTEGAMKLFLSVYFKDYRTHNLSEELKQFKNRKGDLIEPDELGLEKLKLFFSERVLPSNARAIWKASCENDWLDWIAKIQQRRNAIHAYKSRDIGNFEEFHGELKNYLIFLRKINYALPYPDDYFRPREC